MNYLNLNVGGGCGKAGTQEYNRPEKIKIYKQPKFDFLLLNPIRNVPNRFSLIVDVPSYPKKSSRVRM
jgi:hypothetical protein